MTGSKVCAAVAVVVGVAVAGVTAGMMAGAAAGVVGRGGTPVAVAATTGFATATCKCENRFAHTRHVCNARLCGRAREMSTAPCVGARER
jgi:hypothetical protein